jgi:EmrB/QacA subfamily drug resistance transporter
MTNRNARPGVVLAVMCLAAFAVNIDVTIVNVTLPSLVTSLDASTRQLQWIVDAYTLTFAALVLAAGILGDRFGRRATLVVGTIVYGVGNALAALTDGPTELAAARAVMGVGAALMFPTTLSILTNVFTERAARARAIGLWGAATGLAVAAGPIAGGALLESYEWPATFWVKVPVAVVVVIATVLLVPTSRDPERPRLDVPGLVLSIAAIGLLVFGIIEAPANGWSSPATIGLVAAALGLGTVFVLWERRVSQPMLDVRLFADRRFSISAAGITVAFFALAGFIFLVTQYFQFLREYGPLETGLRTLPVAIAVAVGSVLGTRLALTVGNRVVVGTGLVLLTVAFLWISTLDGGTTYPEIAGQMILLGAGMGLTSAPGTEALMGAVSTAKAGAGAGVNDATRELGATLGVAVIGSVFATLYERPLATLAGLPQGLAERAAESLGAALGVAESLAAQGEGAAAETVRRVAATGFYDGLQAGTLVAAAVAAAGAAAAWAFLPGRPRASLPPGPPTVGEGAPAGATGGTAA